MVLNRLLLYNCVLSSMTDWNVSQIQAETLVLDSMTDWNVSQIHAETWWRWFINLNPMDISWYLYIQTLYSDWDKKNKNPLNIVRRARWSQHNATKWGATLWPLFTLPQAPPPLSSNSLGSNRVDNCSEFWTLQDHNSKHFSTESNIKYTRSWISEDQQIQFHA